MRRHTMHARGLVLAGLVLVACAPDEAKLDSLCDPTLATYDPCKCDDPCEAMSAICFPVNTAAGKGTECRCLDSLYGNAKDWCVEQSVCCPTQDKECYEGKCCPLWPDSCAGRDCGVDECGRSCEKDLDFPCARQRCGNFCSAAGRCSYSPNVVCDDGDGDCAPCPGGQVCSACPEGPECKVRTCVSVSE